MIIHAYEGYLEIQDKNGSGIVSFRFVNSENIEITEELDSWRSDMANKEQMDAIIKVLAEMRERME